eukprot:m.438030 g.438030  ORF g.438030 m.438030 type:complete len:80 (+) comp18184_c0_seq1:703-942(+)
MCLFLLLRSPVPRSNPRFVKNTSTSLFSSKQQSVIHVDGVRTTILGAVPVLAVERVHEIGIEEGSLLVSLSKLPQSSVA